MPAAVKVLLEDAPVLAECAPGVPRGFDDLVKHFSKHGGIADRARSIVVIRVDRALPLISPAYDGGQAEESDIRRLWTKRFREIQPGNRFVE